MNKDIIKSDNFISADDLHSAYWDLRINFAWTVASDKQGSGVRKASFGRGWEHEGLEQAYEEIKMIRYFDEYIRNSGLPDCGKLRHFYINCIKPGDQFTYHTDQTGSTVMIYVNPVWKWHWGSGTKFKRGRFIDVVRPKPARVVCFPGQTLHKPIPPNLWYNDFGRLSIAFQYDL